MKAEEWKRFSLHAAPEAIVSRLQTERRKRRVADLEIARLEDLLVVRTRQVSDRAPWCDGTDLTCGHPGPAPLYDPEEGLL